jgi:hypothetical protein
MLNVAVSCKLLISQTLLKGSSNMEIIGHKSATIGPSITSQV